MCIRDSKNPELERVVYFTPKVAPIYTTTNAQPKKKLYFKVVLLTPKSFFHEKITAIKKAPKNLNALRVNGSNSVKLISIKR